MALQHKVLDERRQKESLENPTEAMIEIMNRIEQRELERQSMSWQQQLHHLNSRKVPYSRSTSENFVNANLNPNPLTPAMEEVIQMRQKRISVDIDVPITPEPSDSDESEESGDDQNDNDQEASEDVVDAKENADEVDNVNSHPFSSTEPSSSSLPTTAPSSSVPSSATSNGRKRSMVLDPFEFSEDDDFEPDLPQYRSCLKFVQAKPKPTPEFFHHYGRNYSRNESFETSSCRYEEDPVTVEMPKRELAAPPETASPSEVAPLPMKKRRISIQNDVTPIVEKKVTIVEASKEEITKPATKVKKRGRGRPPWKHLKQLEAAATPATSITASATVEAVSENTTPTIVGPQNAKKLSIIPEEGFIESTLVPSQDEMVVIKEEPVDVPEVEPQTPTKKRGPGRPPGSTSKHISPENVIEGQKRRRGKSRKVTITETLEEHPANEATVAESTVDQSLPVESVESQPPKRKRGPKPKKQLLFEEPTPTEPEVAALPSEVSEPIVDQSLPEETVKPQPPKRKRGPKPKKQLLFEEPAPAEPEVAAAALPSEKISEVSEHNVDQSLPGETVKLQSQKRKRGPKPKKQLLLEEPAAATLPLEESTEAAALNGVPSPKRTRGKPRKTRRSKSKTVVPPQEPSFTEQPESTTSEPTLQPTEEAIDEQPLKRKRGKKRKISQCLSTPTVPSTEDLEVPPVASEPSLPIASQPRRSSKAAATPPAVNDGVDDFNPPPPVEPPQPRRPSKDIVRKKPKATRRRKSKIIQPVNNINNEIEPAAQQQQPPPKNQTGLRKNMRSADASMRTTRAQDWKWENVLVTNPEKVARKSKK